MASCRHRAVALIWFVSAVVAAPPAWAAKWATGCPPIREKLIKAGGPAYTPSLFEHVGHDIVLRLKEKKGVPYHGGFSTTPDGNTVQITFRPLNGPPIPLPPFTVTAVSASTLRFPAPDTRPTLGRLVVGPAIITVHRGEELFVKGTKWPVILPPMNDLRALSEQNGEVEAFGAVDFNENLWVPFNFGGFGSGMPMPSCPAEMTPIVGFAADFGLKGGDDQLVPHASFVKLKKTKLFLGDFDVFGVNLYGTKLRTLLDVTQIRRGAFTVCGLNDTLELVMMIPLKEGASRAHSKLPSDGSPIPLKFRNISADPDAAAVLSRITEDSAENPCVVP
jgi:hypothetical protein